MSERDKITGGITAPAGFTAAGVACGIKPSGLDDAQESSDDRSSYSLHMAERGTDAMEREKTMLFAQREGAYLDYLDEALVRVADGTYGSCRVCNTEIGRARLEAVPTATQCIDCKSKADQEAASGE